MSTVVYSPHTDDAIFSVGAYIINIPDVRIVTPFAGIPDDDIGRAKHTRLRAEHAKACGVIDAQPINGDFLDDVYPAPRRGDVRAWMAQYLDSDTVMIPFGIHHPDHLITTNMLISLLYNNPVVPDRVLFYEDLPYRVDYTELANARFTHIENLVGRLRMIEDLPSAYAQSLKESAVRCYTSQIGGDVLSRVLVRERVWELIR